MSNRDRAYTAEVIARRDPAALAAQDTVDGEFAKKKGAKDGEQRASDGNVATVAGKA